MLGAKGDSIIDQMEDLTIEKPSAAARPEPAPISDVFTCKGVANVSAPVDVCLVGAALDDHIALC